ncbi:hypothetical protein FB446DRAFT_772423 [Lentinula raphanica]|nr:hypothetical protein FB446DRAFT_772423 [Lentinula raphanica]
MSATFLLPSLDQSSLSQGSSSRPSKRSKTYETQDSPGYISSEQSALLSSPTLSQAEITSLRTELDEEDLDYETHAIRCALQEAMQASNSKKDNYSRHVSRYLSFIQSEQERRSREHPDRKSNLTAEPVTVAKVALFLNFETTRPKTKGGTGTVGAESISQAISALENHRFNHQHEHIYQICPESQKKLRDDPRISTFEKHARRNEHLRAMNAEKMKTSGPISATYTPAQLRKLAITSLQPPHKTPASLARSLRDRAIILLCAAMAFRGDSVRSLQLSDLGIEDMPLPAIAPGATVKVYYHEF